MSSENKRRHEVDIVYWKNQIYRSRPVSSDTMKKPGPGEPRVGQIVANTHPTMQPEVSRRGQGPAALAPVC